MRRPGRDRHRWLAAACAIALPLLCAAAVVAATRLAPGAEALPPLLIALPAVYSVTRRDPRLPLVAGAAAVAGGVTLAILDPGSSPLHSGRAAAIVAVAVTASAWVRARRGDERRLAELSTVADTLQRVLVRPVPGRVGTLRAEVRYVAGCPHGGVGGDLCDVVSTPYGARAIIGDVCGKGLAAAEQMTDVLGAFRELAQHEPTLAGVALRLDSYLSGRDVEKFTTALLVEAPAGESFATLVHCGHPQPLLLRRGSATFVEPLAPGLPLGLSQTLGFTYAGEQVFLEPGDRLLLYTDGVTEARDAGGAFYPLLDRVRTHLASADLVTELEADLIRHTGGRLHDDAALFLLTNAAAERAPVLSSPARRAAGNGDAAGARAGR